METINKKLGCLKPPKYNPQNIDKALKRMEDADNLKDIKRSGTNIMSFFDKNDELHELQKKQSAAELKKKNILKVLNYLKDLLQKLEPRTI